MEGNRAVLLKALRPQYGFLCGITIILSVVSGAWQARIATDGKAVQQIVDIKLGIGLRSKSRK